MIEDALDLPGDWCQLTVFAPDRADFFRQVDALGLSLPRGWKKTRPRPTTTHSCGWDEVPHVAPLMATPTVVAGTIEGLLEVLESAAANPKRGTYFWRLNHALINRSDVRICELIR
ncbi:hypothetical protein [Jannaschia sp. R86511]|uniref:hypothetical protein n=1 Tax=Jannaschia sp. R86511 TaxID=3093853 RepID=UPI0036D308F3